MARRGRTANTTQLADWAGLFIDVLRGGTGEPTWHGFGRRVSKFTIYSGFFFRDENRRHRSLNLRRFHLRIYSTRPHPSRNFLFRPTRGHPQFFFEEKITSCGTPKGGSLKDLGIKATKFRMFFVSQKKINKSKRFSLTFLCFS